MSQTLKVVFALVFVAVLGWVLLQPVFDAVDVDPRETRDDSVPAEAPDPSPAARPSPDSTETDGGRAPLPEGFRTEPLFTRFPTSCLQPSPLVSDAIAVDRGDRIATGPLGGPLEEHPARALAGVSVDGQVAWKGNGGVVLAGPDSDVVRPPADASDLVWSPVSPCAVVMARDRSALLVIPSGRSLVRADVRDAAFSPDGQKLAIVVDGPRASSVWVTSLSAGRLREVMRDRPGVRIDLEGWSPDGKVVYVTSRDGGLSFVTASSPPQSGGVSIRPAEALEHCGERLLGLIEGRVAHISVRGPDYLTGAEADYRYISCSPDGSFIAAIGTDGLVLLDRNGTFLRDLTQDSGYTDVFVDWGARGRGLIFGRVGSDGSPVAAELWHIPEGGTPVPTGITYRGGPRAVDWAASPPTGLP